jgi:tetratricopeptide (TPR) repeat protein
MTNQHLLRQGVLAWWRRLWLSSQTREAQGEIEKGNQLFAHGAYDPAIMAFSQAIRLDPGNIQSYLCRGLAREKKGYWDAAMADFREVLRLNPGMSECLGRIAALERRLGACRIGG